MVTPFLEIQVFGESAISRRMLRFSERAADVSPALEEIAKMFYESEAKQFESEVVGHLVDGNHWLWKQLLKNLATTIGRTRFSNAPVR